MEYRILPRGKEKISTIGLPSGGEMFNMSYEDIVKAYNYAFDKGVNIVDNISHRDNVELAVAEAIKPVRKNIYIQEHFGIDYPNGQYSKLRDLDNTKRFIERDLKILDTDYIDFGLIANVDTEEDLDVFMGSSGLWDYMESLKSQGVIKHLAFSSHSTDISNHLLDMGCFDLFMFSENMAEDFGAPGSRTVNPNGISYDTKRQALFSRAEKEGIGITCMKTFLGGKLLNAATSPFKQAFTPYQCIKYVLDRPAFLSCLTGISSFNNLVEILKYYDVPESEKDYSSISSVVLGNMNDCCIYCDHCQPCSAEIDISRVNKFMDLAQIGDTDAIDHYKTLKYHASDCIECGLCDERCPFDVKPMSKIAKAKKYFGF